MFKILFPEDMKVPEATPAAAGDSQVLTAGPILERSGSNTQIGNGTNTTGSTGGNSLGVSAANNARSNTENNKKMKKLNNINKFMHLRY